MSMALKEADKAYLKNEVPVGAVIVKQQKIISRAHNLKETKYNPLAHAEILCIEKAAKKLGVWRLLDCDLYVTLEPCAMCAGAIIQARINRLIIGTSDPKAGACGSVIDILNVSEFNHSVEVITGILTQECSGRLKDFFVRLRNNRSKKNNPEAQRFF